MLRIILYGSTAAALSVLSNCYLVIRGSLPLFLLAVLLTVGINLSCGLLLIKTKTKRLRILNHGTMLLFSFTVSLTVSAVFHLLILTKAVSCSSSAVVGSILFCIAVNFITFWNGILCVYLTSVQLGIKYRVIGALCGMIPVVHLIVLRKILHTALAEVRFELDKERLNDTRAGERICRTKYPILLVHGVFFRDFRHLNYWGRIPAELEKNGAKCFYGNHQSAASVKESGEELAARIRRITEETGCEKVNIIAHSKGGLDCRYAIKYCGISDHVASLTTVNTPHRGCLFADWLLGKVPLGLKLGIAAAYNKAARLIGDTSPDFLAAVKDLTADACRRFDEDTDCPAGIFGQSIGSVIHRASSGRFPLNLSHNFVARFDGQNDGLVGKDSFSWGDRHTLLDLPLKRGISHADMIDLNRENIEGFDVREFYVGLLNDLRERGL